MLLNWRFKRNDWIVSVFHTFSAFWLRSSVVSVLISLISDTCSYWDTRRLDWFLKPGGDNGSLLSPCQTWPLYCTTSERCGQKQWNHNNFIKERKFILKKKKGLICAPRWVRTTDLQINSLPLCQLSHGSSHAQIKKGFPILSNNMWLAFSGWSYKHKSRDSSVGRASDWRSEGPRIDAGSRHYFFVVKKKMQCSFLLCSEK